MRVCRKWESGERGGDDGAVLDQQFGDGEGVDGFIIIIILAVGGAGGGERGGSSGKGRGGGVRGGEGEEDGVGVPGAVLGVGVGAKSEGVEDALDVIFLDGGKEGLVWSGVVGLVVGADGGDVCSVDVFVCDEAEALVAGCVCRGLDALFHVRFPDHVANSVADLEENFDDVGAEGGCVEG